MSKLTVLTSIHDSKLTSVMFCIGLVALFSVGCEQSPLAGGGATGDAQQFASAQAPGFSAPGSIPGVSTSTQNPSATTSTSSNPFWNAGANSSSTAGNGSLGGSSLGTSTPSTNSTSTSSTSTTSTGTGGSSTPTTTTSTPTTVSVPSQCNTMQDINQYMQALSQQNSSEFGGTCGGNYFYLTNVAYGGFGCKSRMAYNIKGDEQAKAFLAANSQSLDLGFPSYIVGIHAGSSEMAGRAVVKGPTGQCSMMTLLGVVVQGISQAQINSKLQAFYNSTAKQQQDRVYGAILKN